MVPVRSMIVAVILISYQSVSACEGGPEWAYEGLVTSNAVEALGIDNVERCYPGPQSFIQDLEWLCKTRYCCEEPCSCKESRVIGQTAQCPPDAALNMNMTCLVLHQHSVFRWFKWKCCEGYVEHPDTHFCLITCVKDNGGCDQICTNAADSPHNALCSCKQGYKVHPNDTNQCIDIDECAGVSKGGCSHDCVNTAGSYTCQCPDGYELQTGSSICKEIAVSTPTTSETSNSDTVVPPIAAAVKDSDNSNQTFIIIAVIGSIVFLAILILLIVFLCRRKKHPLREVFVGEAYANDTYGDLAKHEATGGADGGYTDVDEMKKVPIDGAVGVVNPAYDDTKRPLSDKELEAAGYSTIAENAYDEIPYTKGGKGTNESIDILPNMVDTNDGYEKPINCHGNKAESFNKTNHSNPNRESLGEFTQPPEYSEIPTLKEINADPRPPAYSSPQRQPVRFKDFQSVGYDNEYNEIQDHYVDINDVKLKKGKK